MPLQPAVALVRERQMIEYMLDPNQSRRHKMESLSPVTV